MLSKPLTQGLYCTAPEPNPVHSCWDPDPWPLLLHILYYPALATSHHLAKLASAGLILRKRCTANDRRIDAGRNGKQPTLPSFLYLVWKILTGKEADHAAAKVTYDCPGVGRRATPHPIRGGSNLDTEEEWAAGGRGRGRGCEAARPGSREGAGWGCSPGSIRATCDGLQGRPEEREAAGGSRGCYGETDVPVDQGGRLAFCFKNKPVTISKKGLRQSGERAALHRPLTQSFLWVQS